MKGTAAWREKWRGVTTRSCVALVRLYSTDGATLQLSTTPHALDNGTWWDGGILEGSIQSQGAFLSNVVSVPKASFICNDDVMSATGGLKLSKYLAAHGYIGGDVIIWLTDTSLTASEAMPRFVGRLQTYATSLKQVTFTCLGSRDWNRDVRPRVITRAEFPNAPEEAMGTGLPIVIGSMTGAPFRIENAPYPVAHAYRDKFAGGTRAASAVLVDMGRGYGASNPPATIMVAGHKCVQVGLGVGPSYGTNFFIEGEDGLLHAIEPASADVFNTDTGAGFKLPDNTGTAWQPVFPVDVEQTSPQADNARAILERHNETSFAKLDYTAGKVRIAAAFGAGSEPGTLKNAYAYLIYRTSGAMTGAYFRVEKGGGAGFIPVPVSATTTGIIINMGNAWGLGMTPTQPWAWSELKLAVAWLGSSGNAGTVEVVNMGIAAEYVPSQDFLTNIKTIETRVRPELFIPGKVVYESHEVVRDMNELRGKFYANVKGYPDDALGTYTGAANALVERIPDVARLMLQVFGGVATGNINLTPGTVGCFTDARALMKTWRGTDMVAAFGIHESVDLQTVLSWLMEACLFELYPSEFDGVWRFIPWTLDPPATYTIPIAWRDLLDPESGIRTDMTADSDIIPGVRMPYAWNAQTKGYGSEVALANGRSVAGHAYRGLRDGSMTVVAATNDALDWSVSAVFGGAVAATKAATIPAATYTEDTLPQAVVTAMNAQDASRKYLCGMAGRVVAGFNDALEFVDPTGTINRLAIIPAGVYSMPDLAAAVGATLAASQAGWSCSYTRSTRLFTVVSPGGSSAIRTTGPDAFRSAWAMLGYGNGYSPSAPQSNLAVPSSRTGIYTREEERFYIGCATTSIDLNWRSGPSGYMFLRRTCAEVLGFDWNNDSTGGQSSFFGVCPKNSREGLIGVTDAAFGRKRELTVDGRAVNDTDTALESRNRLVDLQRTIRGTFTMSSEIHADAERGDVIPFYGDIDAYQPYTVPGSDGAWEGKKARVLETKQSFGTSFTTDMVLLDLN